MPKITLDRILQSQGFGSRKYCRRLIEKEEILINDDIVSNHSATYDTENLAFTVFGEEWQYRGKIYIALNKPPNIECSRKPSCHPGVLSILPEQFSWRGAQSVGRLDHDTTGLLLISDDGNFIHAQCSPKKHVPKLYIARTYYPVTDELVDNLLTGVKLHDECQILWAVNCRILDTHEIEIALHQGKYHQIKRMLAAVGNHCLELKRIGIGNLMLESLKIELGEWCYLEQEDIASLI